MKIFRGRPFWNIGLVFVVFVIAIGGSISNASLVRILDNVLGIFGINFDFFASSNVSPEAYLTAPQLIEYNGYRCENHEVETSDGYLLEMHRITGKLHDTKRSDSDKKPAVLLMHCIFCSSGVWVSNGLEDSLGFQLADEGFDVWLANLRGNVYSRKHKHLSPDSDSQFWDFSLDDHALSDLPAKIDYILKTTKSKTIAYVGQSLGSFLGVLMLSGKPEYNQKIHQTVLEAPYVFGRYATNPLRLVKVFYRQLNEIYSYLPTYEFLPSTSTTRSIIRVFCGPDSRLAWICHGAVMIIGGGYNDQLFNEERFHIQIQHGATGSSWKVATHIAQNGFLDNVYRYDYGSDVNVQKYGQSAPPIYNFSQISSPLFMFVGEQDLFTHYKDVDRFVAQLSGEWTRELVKNDQWSHADFLFAKKLKFYLNDRVVDVLKKALAKLPKEEITNKDDNNLT